MERLLLFDGACSSCSEVARRAEELGEGAFVTGPLLDPDLQRRVKNAGFEVPSRPALFCDDAEQPRLLVGLRMRMELVRLLGLRRSRRILQLLSLDLRANANQIQSSGRVLLSRRRALGVMGAGAAGIALGGMSPAHASAEGRGVSVPSQETVDRVMREPAVRAAVRAHGPIARKHTQEVRKEGERILALQHRDTSVMTFVDARAEKRPTVLSIGAIEVDGERRLRYFAPDGTHLGDLRLTKDRTEPLPAEPTPDWGLFEVICFWGCVDELRDWSCADACFSCVTGQINPCAYCAICAGLPGVRCARECLGSGPFERSDRR